MLPLPPPPPCEACALMHAIREHFAGVPITVHDLRRSGVGDDVIRCMDVLASAFVAYEEGASTPCGVEWSAWWARFHSTFACQEGRQQDWPRLCDGVRFVAGMLSPETSLGLHARDFADVLLTTPPTSAKDEAAFLVHVLRQRRTIDVHRFLRCALYGRRHYVAACACADAKGERQQERAGLVVAEASARVIEAALLPHEEAYAQMARSRALPVQYVQATLAERVAAEAFRVLRSCDIDVTALDSALRVVATSGSREAVCASVVSETYDEKAWGWRLLLPGPSHEQGQGQGQGQETARAAPVKVSTFEDDRDTVDLVFPLGRISSKERRLGLTLPPFGDDRPFRYDSHAARFHACHNLMTYLDDRFWDAFRPRGVVCAGGAAMHGLVSGGIKEQGDVDLFVVRDRMMRRAASASGVGGDGIDDAAQLASLAQDIAAYLTEKAAATEWPDDLPVFAYVTRNALTLEVGFVIGSVKVQIMTRLFACIDEVLASFDLDPCRVAYDGAAYYVTESARHALGRRLYVRQPACSTTLYRLCKYATRGFSCAVPRALVDNVDIDAFRAEQDPLRLDRTMREEGASAKGMYAAARLDEMRDFCRHDVTTHLARKHADEPEAQEMSSGDWWSARALYMERQRIERLSPVATRVESSVDLILRKFAQNGIAWTEEPLKPPSSQGSDAEKTLPPHIERAFLDRIIAPK